MFNRIINEIKLSKIEKDPYINTKYIFLFMENIKKFLFFDFYNIKKPKKVLKIAYKNICRVLKSKDINPIFKNLPKLRQLLMMDAKAIFNGDPAANSLNEVITIYLTFDAIFAYRIAHEFYLIGQKVLARSISELAHSLTGIDIHPGAKIGKSFCIDHGTGIVIGETTVIGNNCKLYHGVTLGALSLSKGHKLQGTKRHPTLKDNITIYAGASILGGETIIGNNVVIGCNIEIKSSIADNQIVKNN